MTVLLPIRPAWRQGGLEGVVPSILVVRRNCCEEGECHNLAYKLIVKLNNYSIMFLASVVCWIACSDTEDEDKETMCPDSEDINKIEIVKEMLSATDSSFFASLLPLLERNRVIRLDSRDDLSACLPDTLPVPEDLDFERYTYLLGSAELHFSLILCET